MTSKIVHFGCGLAFLVATACAEQTEPAETQTVPSQADFTESVRLDWADLMPEGEEERLNEMYDDFYRDLDRRLMSNQQSLSSYDSSIGGIEEGSALDEMPQLGTFRTVAELDGEKVKLPGFIVPLDFEAKGRLQNFLLVPYFGACIHTPPPPPNQIVYVEGDVKLDRDALWQPHWVYGVMHTKRNENDLGDAAYTLTLSSFELYED